MPADYRSIANDRARLERIATNSIRTLTNLYAEPAHFVFELLQNAEDALRRRGANWCGPRAVKFQLSDGLLRVGHFGIPFNEADVQSICSVGETTKELTDIGRFGIGFKSVYTVTDRPEIHSGAEDFAIERFVWPVAAPPIERDPEETAILIPLKPTDGSTDPEIIVGLERLGTTALLFLRGIEEIRWSAEDGRSGLWLRESMDMAPGVRRVIVIGQVCGVSEVHEEWLVFSRPIAFADGPNAGHVEIAFVLVRDKDCERQHIERATSSRLVVFFPTVLETHLGFLVQGPYRTTPGRDNVPPSDRWNQHLVLETGALLVESLRWLRDHKMLDTGVLQCLPLDPTKFDEGSRFFPLFVATKNALVSDKLLPRFGDGYVRAGDAKLARSQDLRELFGPSRLAALFRRKGKLFWLSGDITQERTSELRQYLMRELDIAEITPEMIIPKFDKHFLGAQSNNWILNLYEFLNGQPSLRWRLENLPIIRLENGTHVIARINGQPQAFLPSAVATDFPSLNRAVCKTKAAREFLRSLGLTEPDPVDDVVRNVLPKYCDEKVDIDDDDYVADMRRILTAFGTDSKSQRAKLLNALSVSAFLKARDAVDQQTKLFKPDELYIATDELSRLFAGVRGVLFVDQSYDCLRTEAMRDLLEACGASRCLQPVSFKPDFPEKDLREMRIAAGYENSTWLISIEDYILRGLDNLLELFPTLGPAERTERAAFLWEALGDVESRGGAKIFSGSYRWQYYSPRSKSFDAAFVRKLNAIPWVPDKEGALRRPELVIFDNLCWKPNPFLQSKIIFKPPIMEALAREAGIELAVLDLLKEVGVTRVADLRARLYIEDRSKQNELTMPADVDKTVGNLVGDLPEPTPPSPETGLEPSELVDGRGEDSETGVERLGHSGKRTPGSPGGRPFFSYVGAHPNEDERDPDGLDQEARIALEGKGIQRILASEPNLGRMRTHNPGYDLIEVDGDGRPVRWIEVKAMTGSLMDRPVGLSRQQFESAREHAEKYWLYVVEHAGEAGRARIIRIQDPAGKARTYTFDHGWLNVADVNAEQESQEENDGED